MKPSTFVLAALIAVVLFFSNAQAARAAFDPNEPIDILTVVDTDHIKERYTNPSQDQNNPTAINSNSQFMIVTNDAALSGQGTGWLNFRATVGQSIRLFGTSASANSNDAIIIYGVLPSGSPNCPGPYVTSIFDFPFVARHFELPKAVQPSHTFYPYNGLPPNLNRQEFQYLESIIASTTYGVTEEFCIQFALFDRSEGGDEQQLVGYYYWYTQVTVE